MRFPKSCIVDTNVPKTANLATRPDPKTDVPDKCVLACVEAIDHVIKTKGLVIDDGEEIFDEYRQQLSMKGQPGVGDKFMKWVHDNRWRLPDANRVTITKNGETYDEFPVHEGLKDFDRSDRKFVAVANAHRKHPPILQATDSKWWGWKEPLKAKGIKVRFVCAQYAETKYKEKMGG